MTDPLHAIPISTITITHSLDDQGRPTTGVAVDGEDSKTTLLGLLTMAQHTIMSPEWDEEGGD